MNFSTRGEYGLRAAVNLARCYPLRKSLRSVSAEERISLKYLERLFSELKNNRIVKSVKGKRGGYYLSSNPKNIKIGRIIEATEGPIVVKCHGTNCKNIKNCRSSYVWLKLGDQIKKTLYSIKLSDLVK